MLGQNNFVRDPRVMAVALGATGFPGKPFNPAILEARLKSSIAKKSRDALTHMIVHDLGNPLAMISMNTEVLQMSSAMGMAITPEGLAGRLGHITTASGTMAASATEGDIRVDSTAPHGTRFIVTLPLA